MGLGRGNGGGIRKVQTGTVTAEGEAGANREGSGGRGEKVVRWSRMCWSTGRSTRGAVPISFGTYNIYNDCSGGLELVLR